MTVRALLFDLWGTLIDVTSPDSPDQWRRSIFARAGAVLADCGHHFPVERFTAALEAFTVEQRGMHAAGRDVSQPERVLLLLDHIESGLAACLPSDALVAFEDALTGGQDIDPPVATPGAAQALEQARSRGLKVGLVSITGLTPGYVLRRVLADLDLLQHLQVMTFSDEARLAKPADAIYRCTLEALGVEPHEAVFIGDSPGPDIAGPQKLGMTAVQVGDREQAGVTPDAQLDSLEELFPALRRLGLVD